jgi:hypothetical protein
MVRWSFERAGFPFDLENVRPPVQIFLSRVLDRIAFPDFEIDESFINPDHMRKEAKVKDPAGKCMLTPKASEYPINSAAHIQTRTGTCPLCGHEEEKRVSHEEKSEANETDPVRVTFRLAFVTFSIADP